MEFRTRNLTDAAMQLDKLELCGRPMNIGRPKGFVDTPAMPNLSAFPNLAQPSLAALSFAATGGMPGMAAAPAPAPAPMMALAAPALNVVMLEHLVSVATIRDDNERKEVRRDEVDRGLAAVGAAGREGTHREGQTFWGALARASVCLGAQSAQPPARSPALDAHP